MPSILKFTACVFRQLNWTKLLLNKFRNIFLRSRYLGSSRNVTGGTVAWPPQTRAAASLEKENNLHSLLKITAQRQTRSQRSQVIFINFNSFYSFTFQLYFSALHSFLYKNDLGHIYSTLEKLVATKIIKIDYSAMLCWRKKMNIQVSL